MISSWLWVPWLITFAGAYAGRKALSRAFRGRFLELHVEELPDSELAEILHKRCGIAPTYAAKMVAVMRELQRRRQRSNVFAGVDESWQIDILHYVH
jgi:midasin